MTESWSSLSDGELVLAPFEQPVAGVQSLGYLHSIGYILKVTKFLFKCQYPNYAGLHASLIKRTTEVFGYQLRKCRGVRGLSKIF